MILDLPVLAVTPGDPAGIGPECALRMAAIHPELRLLLVADPELLRATARAFAIPVELHQWSPGESVTAGRVSCHAVGLGVPATPGRPDPANAPYVLECLRHAVGLVRDGHAGALVTGPVHKGVINDAGIPFSGHTEFLAELADVPRVVMMLVAGDLRVALVTTHLALRDVPAAVTPANVLSAIRITHAELARRFGLPDARIQVLGLNPHAGESGHLGDEDAGIIAPAIAKCRSEGIRAWGPVPADTAFTPAALETCDAVIAMYHDQGLPVLKHAGFGRSVNVTLGLPFVRTSVDHGTAMDIAGSGTADPSSFFQAASMAGALCLESL
jgi:4-hydroxythreonine-4-phosphate dehydrogenase